MRPRLMERAALPAEERSADGLPFLPTTAKFSERKLSISRLPKTSRSSVLVDEQAHDLQVPFNRGLEDELRAVWRGNEPTRHRGVVGLAWLAALPIICLGLAEFCDG